MVFTAKKILGFVAVLSLAACSSSQNDLDGTIGSAGGSSNPMTNGQIDANALAPNSVAYFKQEIGNKVYFGYDQYTLTAEAQANLAAQAAWVKQYAPNSSIMVEGHCDERGTREYNLGLGARRAASARSFLISQGLNASQIKGLSFGKERPEVTGSDAMSWAKNRRSVTVIN